MLSNTINANQSAGLFDDSESVWLFGYGSLIYKVDFPYLERQKASIKNWTRRFWQGSHDHRGTPEAPGRVVTLIEDHGATCGGIAYRITPEIFRHLDHREKNGYLRLSTELILENDSKHLGLVYIAMPDNTAFLGPASEQEIAVHIAGSEGPSGSNRDYLNQLAMALRAMTIEDPHVFSIEKYLQATA